MADSSIPISVQGYKRLEKELAELKEERPHIIQAIKEAREEGDCVKTPVTMPPESVRACVRPESSTSNPDSDCTR